MPADPAGERESLKIEISLALSAELGLQLVGMTRRARGSWELAISELADVGATAAEVTGRCAAFRAVWPAMKLTENALVRHWSMLGAQVAIDSAGGSLDRWLAETAPLLDPEHAHEIVANRPGLSDGDRAVAHTAVDELRDRRAA